MNHLKEHIKVPLPFVLEQLLKAHNGEIPLYESFLLLSKEDILQTLEDYAIYGHWSNDFLPMAKNDEDDFLMLDMGRNGAVLWWNRDQGVLEEVSDNLELLLEGTRDDVLKQKVEWVEGVGLVGKM